MPRREVNLPALVLELKYNTTVETAINQIKAKHYTNSLVDYVGEVIMVGVNYDRRTKKHQCSIERVTKGSQALGRNVPEKDLEKDLEKLTDNQRKILAIMKENPYVTQSELSSLIGINSKNIRNNIAKLKSTGRLTRVGPDKGGWWKVVETGN
ncbi:MAG: winged helix-turn-helix transcriptional regulator [Bacteroidales bacterium]|nr:winged helix-turn-helix transcriptional regulator [Bacteroidales bacterium]